MRKYIFLGFLFSCSNAFAIGLGVELTTHTFVGNNSVITAQTTPPINTLGSTFCAVEVTYTFNQTVSVVDNYGNIWSAATTSPNLGAGSITTIVYSSTSLSGAPLATGPNHTFSAFGPSTPNIFSSMAVACFAGVLSSSSPFDVANSTVSTSNTTSQNTLGITTTSNNELVISAVGANNASLPFTVTGGLTITDSNEFNANNYSSALAYIVQGTAGAVNPTWTKTGSVAQMSTAIASFKVGPFVTNTPRTVIIK